tara:strand:+ start:29 stop:547 length:519 start_codon:yes stop_codon:yes gene_type:complete
MLKEALKTERLVIKSPEIDDKVELTQLINDYDVVQWLSNMPFPYKPEDAEAFIERSQEKILKQEIKTYLIFHNKKMLGGIELRDFNKHSCELGYWLGKKYWGKGFATEAVGRLLELGFDELNLNEIYAAYKVGNKASKKVLEKSGFQFYREKQEFDSVLNKNEQLIEMVKRK